MFPSQPIKASEEDESYSFPVRPRAVNPRVYVGGTFDLFHPGHVELLRKCRDLAGPRGRVFAVLNTDDFVERYKGRRPIMSLEERRAVVRSCRYVDRTFINVGDEDSTWAIDLINPDVIVHGDDWTGEGYLSQLGLTVQYLEENHIELIYLPYTEGISSTAIIARVHQAGPPEIKIVEELVIPDAI
jgi:glycerol-3-phosphate cytidylyltransferase